MSSSNDIVDLNAESFSILSILHHSKMNINKSKLKLLLYLCDEELDNKFTIFSYEKGVVGPEPVGLKKYLTELSNKNVIQINNRLTFGGNKKQDYDIINKNLRNKIIKYNNGDVKKLDSIIKDICYEYSEIPLSNLIEMVKNKNNKYFKNNTHFWY